MMMIKQQVIFKLLFFRSDLSKFQEAMITPKQTDTHLSVDVAIFF